MKHLKIVITLMFVVVLSSVAVFGVESITTPIIRDAQFAAENEALFEVFPELESSDDLTPEEGLDLEGTTIIQVIEIDGKGYIYTAQFQGFQSQIKYMIGVDMNGTITGYKTLEQGDTPGYGAKIAEPAFGSQFVGKDLSVVGEGGFDGIAGATITTGGFTGSIQKLAEFHSVTFAGGVIIEDPDPREEITSIGATFTDVTADYDISGTPIDKIEFANDDEAVIYTVTFEGWQPDNQYIIAFDLETNDVLGFRVIENYETIGIGAMIEDDDFMAQFVGITLDDALEGNIDSVSGATAPVTLGGLNDSLAEVASFHSVTFAGGSVIEEPDLREEITSIGATFTDVTADYDISGTPIEKIEFANDDEAVIYHVVFEGWAPDNVYIIAFDLETHDVLGFRMIEVNETTGIGSLISEDDFMAQFDGLAHDDVLNGNIDSVSGATAPFTLSGLRESLNEVTLFHQTYFGGLETDEEKLERLIGETFPSENSSLREDVTASYPANENILNIFDIYNDDAERIGVVYYAEVQGNSYGNLADIKLLVAVEEGSIMSSVILFDQNETPSIFALNELLNYHIANYLTFLAPEEAALTEAYPDAVSFESIYVNYPYSSTILNVFEAKDATDQVLGYVYYAVASGFGGDITFTWGVDATGVTKNIYIISHGESWNNAYPYLENPTAGYFPNTTWLDQFEGVDQSSIFDNEVDDVAGVSTTTSGLKEALEYISDYHDSYVGGAN